MITAAVGQARDGRDLLGRWCGWVLVGGAVLAPLFAWVWPMGFTLLVSLMGLLSLPALRLTDEDRPVLIVLLGALVWAAVSTTWSPYQPKHPQDGQAVHLAFELPLYFAAVCGARRAAPALQARAATLLAWGLVAVGVVLTLDAVLEGRIYLALHQRFYQPIRVDLAQKNIAQATFAVAVLWPVAIIGRARRARDLALAGPVVIGQVLAAYQFRGDAPILAALGAPLVALLVWKLPKLAPRAMAFVAAFAFLAMPMLVFGVRGGMDYGRMESGVPASWGQRMGYWSHAVDWIRDQPFRGWGLDASRAMGPGIQLHPHNGELQMWLELGLVGAVAAAAFWGLTLLRLARPKASAAAAGAAASAAVYLLFGTINFGLWQEWWMALGAFTAAIAAIVFAPVTVQSST